MHQLVWQLRWRSSSSSYRMLTAPVDALMVQGRRMLNTGFTSRVTPTKIATSSKGRCRRLNVSWRRKRNSTPRWFPHSMLSVREVGAIKASRTTPAQTSNALASMHDLISPFQIMYFGFCQIQLCLRFVYSNRHTWLSASESVQKIWGVQSFNLFDSPLAVVGQWFGNAGMRPESASPTKGARSPMLTAITGLVQNVQTGIGGAKMYVRLTEFVDGPRCLKCFKLA